MSLPIVMTAAGLAPESPTSLHDQVIAGAVALNSGLTANLPGTLIEDIASTDTAALVLIDSAQVETVNSLTPYGANLFVLNQLGQVYGVQQGRGSNTAVYVVFSGTPGFVISAGVIVSDGTYQYVTQSATVINSTGVSNTVYCVASQSGSWAVPANSVTSILSSVPTGVTLTVTNPNTGIPSTGVQSPEDYRSQVLGAGLVACAGTVQAIRSYLQNVPGVVQSLISIRQVVVSSVNRWQVICGGGDPVAVANAIFLGVGDPNVLVGSQISSSRDQTITLYDTPDSYLITYVQPPQQVVTVEITWKTSSTNTVSNEAVQSLCSTPIQEYINALGPGQPINEYELQYVFQSAIVSVVPTPLLTYIDVVVTIDSVVTPPETGTGIVLGDPEGYFFISTIGVTTVKA